MTKIYINNTKNIRSILDFIKTVILNIREIIKILNIT